MKQVLIVDDEAMNREVLSKILKKEGCHVVEAANGQEAIDILAQGCDFDLIVTDIMMPLRDGYDTIAYIRSDAQCNGVPIVVITALKEREAFEKALGLGVDAVLMKPFDLKAFVGLLRQALQQGRSALEPTSWA